MYAIIKAGGKQHKVTNGDYLNIDRVQNEIKSEMVFDKVLSVGGDEIKIGNPYVSGVSVKATVIGHDKDRKVIIYKKRRRKDSKLKKGFRRSYTRIQITEILA
jgi:large subunit ribosomal protein L21